MALTNSENISFVTSYLSIQKGCTATEWIGSSSNLGGSGMQEGEVAGRERKGRAKVKE